MQRSRWLSGLPASGQPWERLIVKHSLEEEVESADWRRQALEHKLLTMLYGIWCYMSSGRKRRHGLGWRMYNHCNPREAFQTLKKVVPNNQSPSRKEGSDGRHLSEDSDVRLLIFCKEPWPGHIVEEVPKAMEGPESQ